MLGRNHLVSSCSGWVIAQPYLLSSQPDLTQQIILGLSVALGSLLPDIDHPDSLLGRRVKFISVPLSFLQGDRSLLPWSEDSHSRGITHSIWALIGCWFLMTSTLPAAIGLILFGLAFGFVAHLIGDAMTPAGVRLFWPLDFKTRSPITFKTGGFIEYLFTTLLATVAVLNLLGVDVMHQLEMLIR